MLIVQWSECLTIRRGQNLPILYPRDLSVLLKGMPFHCYEELRSCAMNNRQCFHIYISGVISQLRILPFGLILVPRVFRVVLSATAIPGSNSVHQHPQNETCMSSTSVAGNNVPYNTLVVLYINHQTSAKFKVSKKGLEVSGCKTIFESCIPTGVPGLTWSLYWKIHKNVIWAIWNSYGSAKVDLFEKCDL